MTDAELTRDGWQSVADGLPETYVTVAGANIEGPRIKHLGGIYHNGAGWFNALRKRVWQHVTHWKPLTTQGEVR